MEWDSVLFDHVPIWCDVSISALFDNSIISQPTYRTRKLKCEDPLVV